MCGKDSQLGTLPSNEPIFNHARGMARRMEMSVCQFDGPPLWSRLKSVLRKHVGYVNPTDPSTVPLAPL